MAQLLGGSYKVACTHVCEHSHGNGMLCYHHRCKDMLPQKAALDLVLCEKLSRQV